MSRSDVRGFQWAVFFTFIRTITIFWVLIGGLITYNSLGPFLFVKAVSDGVVVIFIWISLYRAYYSKVWSMILLLLSAWVLVNAVLNAIGNVGILSVLNIFIILPYFVYSYYCVKE